MRNPTTETDDFVFFRGGWPGQWHPGRFEAGGVFYGCCEQYMMAGKARLFGDDEVLAAILRMDNPKAQKALGRKVRGFDARACDGVWGIGLAADDPRSSDPSQWQGTNWLGEALLRVRAELNV